MSAPGPHELSKEDLQRILGFPDLSAAYAFLKSRPDLANAGVGLYLSHIMDEVPLSRKLRDRCELFARLATDASRTSLDSAYAALAKTEPGVRSPTEWMQLGIRFLSVENTDVAKALLYEYPEIPHEAVKAMAEASMRGAEGAEAERLKQRIGLLDAWPRMKVMWAMQNAQESEERMTKEPTIENLRSVADSIRAVILEPEFQKFPAEARIPVLERSVGMQYSVYANTYDPAALDRTIEDAHAARVLGGRGGMDIFGAALIGRYEITGNVADLDEAIEVLGPFAENPRNEGAPLITNLANALRHRAIARGGTADIDRAVQLYEWLAGLPVSEPARRQIRLVNLAAGLVTRYDRTAGLRDLDRAIEIWDGLVPQIPDADPRKTTLYNNLGLALLKRSRGEKDLERAQAALSQSVNLLPNDSPELPRNLTNAGMGWLAAYRKSDDPEMLDAAIDSLSQAADFLSVRQSEAARTLNVLSEAFLARFQKGGDRNDLDAAFRWAEQGAQRSVPGTPLWQAANLLTARALLERGGLPGDGGDWARAAELYRATLKDAMVPSPLLVLESSLAWAKSAYDRHNWADAAEAYLLALDAHERVLHSQSATELREIRLKRVQGLGALAARCLIHTGDLKAAAAALERGRAALVIESAGGAPGEAPPIAWHRPGSAIVYLENVDKGFALIVREDVRVLELPELNEPEINDWLYKNVGYRVTDPDRWAAALDEICRRLWEVAIGPLLGAVEGLREVTVIAGGLLGMLPLHAAWREDKARPTGRFYACDALCFRCAPNAAVLFRTRKAHAESLLCVDEPQPVNAPALPFSAEEVAAAREHFGKSEVLKGKQATRRTMLDAVPRHSALHLSCHGFANLSNPRQNGFLMANGEFLTLDDLLATRLDAVELAVLSACDAGQMGTALPDQAIGLPSGMLQSGACGVISPLWPVMSWSTVLLIARFYELWRQDGLTPPDALRMAQVWLRDTTNQEKAAHLKNRRPLHLYLLTREPGARDQEQIYAWAPFYYCGG